MLGANDTICLTVKGGGGGRLSIAFPPLVGLEPTTLDTLHSRQSMYMYMYNIMFSSAM